MAGNQSKPKPAVIIPAGIKDWMNKPSPAQNADLDNADDKREAFFKTVMGQIFEWEKPDIRADLTPDQILPYAVGRTVAHRFGDNEMVNGFIDNLLRFSISKGRGSRKEMTEIARGLTPQQEDPNRERVLEDRLFGRRR